MRGKERIFLERILECEERHGTARKIESAREGTEREREGRGEKE